MARKNERKLPQTLVWDIDEKRLDSLVERICEAAKDTFLAGRLVKYGPFRQEIKPLIRHAVNAEVTEARQLTLRFVEQEHTPVQPVQAST